MKIERHLILYVIEYKIPNKTDEDIRMNQSYFIVINKYNKINNNICIFLSSL